jgi:hypothetical protein
LPVVCFGMSSDFEGKRHNTDLFWVVGLLLLAIALRIPGLSASFYGDEEFSLLRDSNDWLTPSEDRFRPIFFTLLFLWKKVGFHGEVGLRLLPFAFGVLQVPVAFRLGRLLGGREAAIVFAGLIAVNPMLIEFSQELRMYSLIPLIALLHAWSFVVVVTRSAEGRRTLVPWLGFVAAGVAGLYTHFHYWFVIGALSVAAVRRRSTLPLKESAIALGTIVLLYLPDVPSLLRFQREAAGAAHLRATDLPSALPKLVAAICVGFNYFKLPHLGVERALRTSVLTANVALTVLMAVPMGIVAFYLVRRRREPAVRPMLRMSNELFTVPAIASFMAVVLMRRDFIHPKYMAFSAPFLLLLLTAGYLSIPQRATRLAVALASAAVFAIGIVHFNDPQDYGRREDCRGATNYLRSALGDDSVLLWLGNSTAAETMTSTEHPSTLWDYYGFGDFVSRARVVAMPRSDATVSEVRPLVEKLTAGKRRVYYLWYEISANMLDSRDSVVESARSLLADERTVQFNPRLILYSWNTSTAGCVASADGSCDERLTAGRLR